MSKNLWDEDDEGAEFLDRPDETRLDNDNRPMQAPPAQVASVQAPQRPRPANIPAEPAPAQQEHDHDFGGMDYGEYEVEEDFTAVLSDANLRIAQGSLYQMIMNHNLFEGMDADPKAVENVQKEIRKFARERMEIMLGMRQEVTQQAVVSSPFNDLEVDILKKIASKATNGATETEQANEVAAAVRQTPKRLTLNPIGGGAPKRAHVPAPAPQQPQRQQTALQGRPSAPLKRTKLDLTIDQICEEEGIPRELLEENYKPLGKPIEALSEQERLQRARETARRISSRTTVKSAQAIPMASPEQQEQLATQRANQMGQVEKLDGLKIPGGMSALLDKVSKMPKSLNVE